MNSQKFLNWDKFFSAELSVPIKMSTDLRHRAENQFKKACPNSFIINCIWYSLTADFFNLGVHEFQDYWTFFVLRKENVIDKNIDDCIVEDYETFFYFKNEIDAIMARMML